MTVGGDDESAVESLAVRTGEVDRVGAVRDRLDRPAFADIDAAPAGDVDECRVEGAARHDRGVGTVRRQRQPRPPAARRDQDGLANEHRVGRGEIAGRDTQLLEEAQRIRGESVTAGLVSGEGCLVDADDVETLLGGGDGRGGAGRTGTYYDDVDGFGHRGDGTGFDAIRRTSDRALGDPERTPREWRDVARFDAVAGGLAESWFPGPAPARRFAPRTGVV